MRAESHTENRLLISFIVLFALTLALIVLTGCSGSAAQDGVGGLTAEGSYGGAYRQGTATGDTENGAAFARWVLDQDPGQEYMTDAVVRNESSLGVKVQPDVTKQDVRQLLLALTEGMARTFPGRPLTVIAFYQSGDKLAESHYDPRTGQVDVAFVQ